MHGELFHRLGGLTRIDGPLHRSPMPHRPEHFDTLARSGIRVVYSLEESVPGHLATHHGLDWRPHFWTDDEPPTNAEMDRFLADYAGVPHETPVVVHCRAGWGRTGSAIACMLITRHGWTAEQALRHFWTRVPPAENVMRNNGQAEFVRGYAARLAGRGISAPP